MNSQKEIQYNLNNKIKVKVTPRGIALLRNKGVTFKLDSKGYLTFQFWEFAGLFGDALQLPTINPPVEPDIVLIKEDDD